MRWHLGLGITLLALLLLSCSNENEDGSQESSTSTSSTTGADRSSDAKEADEIAASDPSSKDGNGIADDSMPSAEQLALGKKAYQTGRCAQCHGDNGQGGQLGPDLTDNEWLHGDGSVDAIRQVLVNGVAREEMKKSWMLPMNSATFLVKDEDQLDALAEYVWSLSH